MYAKIAVVFLLLQFIRFGCGRPMQFKYYGANAVARLGFSLAITNCWIKHEQMCTNAAHVTAMNENRCQRQRLHFFVCILFCLLVIYFAKMHFTIPNMDFQFFFWHFFRLSELPISLAFQ